MKMDLIEYINSLDFVIRSKILPTMEDIRKAEQELGVKFADDYIKCLLNFGQLSFGDTELMGISFCNSTDPVAINSFRNRDVVYQTLLSKSLDCHAHVPKNMYVIDDLGIDMFLVWQDETGAVYSTLPWNGPKKEADSLEEYIKICYEEYESFQEDDCDDW